MSASEPEGVGRGTLYALASILVGGVLTSILTIFLGRALSPSEYGYFAFAVSLASIATLTADLGVSASAARFIAERRSQPAEAAAVLRTSLGLKLVLSAGTALVLFALARPLAAGLGSPGADGAVRWIAAALLGQSMFLLLFAAFEAMGRLRLRLVTAAVESITEVTATVALVLAGAGAAGAALGQAIAYVFAGVLGTIIAVRAFGVFEPVTKAAAGVTARRILTYAGPLLLIDAAFRLFASIDVLLISALLGGGASVAAFELPMRLAAFLDYPAAAVAAAVAPRMARGEGGPDLAAFTAGVRWCLMIQGAVGALLLVWAGPIMHLLFGDRYPEAETVLRVLTPYVLLAAVAQPATLGVNYLGLAARRIPIVIVMLAANVALDVALLPRLGIVASAIGTAVAYAIWVPAHLWLLKRHAGLELRPLGVTMLRGALAGVAMGVVLFVVGTRDDLGFPLMVFGGLLGTGMYGVVLVLTGELRHTDVAAMQQRFRRG